MNENEFPDLSVDTVKQEDAPTNTIEQTNYKEAALKEKKEESINEHPLQLGWVKYYYNQSNKIVMIDNSIKREGEDENEEEKMQNNEQCAIMLIQNLINYRRSYDDLNGEGEYDRVYKPSNVNEEDFGDNDPYE